MPASLIDNHLSFLPAAEILAARDKVVQIRKDEVSERESENILQRPDGRACHVRACVDGSIWLDRELNMRSKAPPSPASTKEQAGALSVDALAG